ncbi:polysaccharide biosynthesis/export family protein [Saccharicrinis sp. FJH54]|uniref:polysaccharide biosynthesis/export family protein n=1 Tax=Saccharicrinis sp. FJH54 TaxID=3344665 RepID=UPI0035D463BF
MKRFIKLPLLSALFILLFSCRSTKDITFFQKLSNEEYEILSNSDAVYDYKIRPLDNIYVSIKTLDPEVNQLFSPSGQVGGYMTGTQQMYGDLVSQFINGYQVDSAGTIVLPILGDIKVSGLSIDEIKQKVQKISLEYLKEPIVSVKLLSFRITINGEVKNPGIYYNYQGKINIIDAISQAGGITDNASLSNVCVFRKSNNSVRTYILDLTNKNVLKSDAYYLFPSDEIYIKPGLNKKIDLNLQTYSLFITTITTLLGLQILYQPTRF